jgi:AcrR family transcriptional regulator
MKSGREMWIEAGLKEIGRSGVEGVRVEVLAAHLGITKGGVLPTLQGSAGLA